MGCCNRLPEFRFVGGTGTDLTFNLKTILKQPFDAKNYVGWFSLVDFSNRDSSPFLSKNLSFKTDADGVKSVAVAHLNPSDTMLSWGKWIYQLTFKNTLSGDVMIPSQGIIFIQRNIDPGVTLI